jgi:hypothetical protein
VSTIAGQRGRVEADRRAPARVVFVWDLPDGTGGLGAGPVRLDITMEGGRFSAMIVCGASRQELGLAVPGVIEFDQERAMWHAGAPGVLLATWREGEAAPLYARSPLLERLRLAGGTYEFRGMRLG